MKLNEIKQLTDNFTNIKKWIQWIKEQPLGSLKLKSSTIKRVPKEFIYYLYIEKFKRVHQDRYKYPTKEWWEYNYIGNKTKIHIICPTHGQFQQRIDSHLIGYKCPKCAINSISNKSRISYHQFIQRANQIHNNKYYYPFNENWWDKNYKNAYNRIPIICPIHGEFRQSVGNHLNGRGCKKCADNKLSNKQRISYYQFIQRATQIHNNKYNYPFTLEWWDENYRDMQINKIPIICPIHGEFHQTIFSHLQGSGCPVCSSSKGELKIKSFLDNNDIPYIHQHKININNKCYSFDFYLPHHNTLIEYDGEQHFRPIKHFGGGEGFLKIQQRDQLKNNFAKQNNIKLVRIPYHDYNKVEEILQKEIIND